MPQHFLNCNDIQSLMSQNGNCQVPNGVVGETLHTSLLAQPWK
jgi:hypothetical protein